MPRPCALARWVAAPRQSTKVRPAESLRLFGASPEAHRRLSPEFRGERLQALAQPCAAVAVDSRRFSKEGIERSIHFQVTWLVFRLRVSYCTIEA